MGEKSEFAISQAYLYPVAPTPIKPGDKVKALITVTHKGPAETRTVTAKLEVRYLIDMLTAFSTCWQESKDLSVGDDTTPKDYPLELTDTVKDITGVPIGTWTVLGSAEVVGTPAKREKEATPFSFVKEVAPSWQIEVIWA